MAFQLVYPDVLGSITSDKRFRFGPIQYAVGIFPRQVFVNQPTEIVVLVQNLVRDNVQIRLDIELPTRLPDGQMLNARLPKSEINELIPPGAVCVMHVPITVVAPVVDINIPIRVTMRITNQPKNQPIRPEQGGPPPSVLAISPFKAQVLKDVAYLPSDERTNHRHQVVFHLSPQKMPPVATPPQYQYEVLWSEVQAERETEMARQHLDLAQRVATSKDLTWEALGRATEERFASYGMPLHPGEVQMIARALAYVVEKAPERERSLPLQNMRWFRTLCQLLVQDKSLAEKPRSELVANELYDAVIYDAILMGFRLVQPRARLNLGHFGERSVYADRMMAWLQGSAKPDLSYIYVPLVMMGIVVIRQVQHRDMGNPWRAVKQIQEALRGRERLGGGVPVIIFDAMQDLLKQTEEELQRTGYPRI
ncbi:MAG: hypothetical protein KC615_16485 [Anaerolineae bacterium]|nr:hypothetical protein [Anaerolineae bacterium]MCB9458609.1 hypothetical protein [Anaerolineaceae bacterium]